MATRWRKDRHEPETGRDAQTGRQTVPRSPDRRRDRAVDSALQGACWACLPQAAKEGHKPRTHPAAESAAAAAGSTPTRRLAQLGRRPPHVARARRSTSSFRTIRTDVYWQPRRRPRPVASYRRGGGTAVGEPAHVPLVAIKNRCGDGDCQDGRPGTSSPPASPGWPAPRPGPLCRLHAADVA